MDLGLKDKVVLVTGGSRGIGLATAKLFAEEGAKVALVGSNPEHVSNAIDVVAGANGAEVLGVAADLRSMDGVEQVVNEVLERFGTLHVLANVAGDATRGRILDVTDEQWHSAFELKLMAAVRLVRAFIPVLEEAGDACVINVAGLAGWQPRPDAVIVGAVNASMLNFTRALVRELAPRGIRVNTVVPSTTMTDRFEEELVRKMGESGRSREELMAEATKNVPLGRISRPEDPAAAIVFLSSTQARQITGVSLQVDGGVDRGLH